MDKFALIDINSGFVWGVTEAANAENACQRIDYDIGERNRTYDTHGPDSGAHRWGKDGYLVYRVPADFEVDDGQDADQIAATEAHPRIAIVLTGSQGDE